MKEDKTVPQLRFPEFTDAWKQRKVGDLLVERREMVTEDNEYPLMAFIANEGVAPKGDRFDRSALVKNADSKKYKITKYGDFIYSSNNLESGSIGLNKYGKASISPVYSIFYPTNLADSDFIGRYFLRKDFIGQMIRWRQGVVYGQWKIPEADFLNIDIYIPSKDEQEKIGQILDKVDNTITLQQRKLNSLQKLKKGLLQRMFPKNGENIPEIRFPEFSDAWKQRKFEDWGTFYYGKSCPKWSIDENAKTPCVRYGELYTKFGNKIDKVFSYTNIEPENLRFSTGKEVLIPRVGEDPFDYNHCTWLSIKGIAIGEMISVFNTDQDPQFSATMFNATLKNEFAKRVEGGSVTNLYFEKLKNILIYYPSLEEQKKIASFFERIDQTITLQQRKLESLQKLKKGLLQQMFI